METGAFPSVTLLICKDSTKIINNMYRPRGLMDKACVTSDQKIPGSSPGGVVLFIFIFDEKEQLPLPNKKRKKEKKIRKKVVKVS